MTKEIEPKFVVSKHHGKYWVEVTDDAGYCLSSAGFMGFSLSRASSSEKEAREVADFLNKTIDKLLFTPF